MIICLINHDAAWLAGLPAFVLSSFPHRPYCPLPPRTQLLFFCLASVQAMTSVLAPLFEPASWPRCLLPKKGTTPSSVIIITLPWGLGPCPLSSLLAAPLAVATAVTWAVMRHADWAWVLQVGWGGRGFRIEVVGF